MKLISARNYKNDFSDIIGILCEQELAGNPLTLEDVKRAVVELYDSYDKVSDTSKQFIEDAFKQKDYQNYYHALQEIESKNYNSLVDFQIKYPNTLTQDNFKDILKAIESKKHK